MSGESTTDTHPAKRDRKPMHPATWPAVIATVLSTAVVGIPGALVRQKDVERIEARQDRMETHAAAVETTVIELKADSRNQDRKLDDIKVTLDALSVKLDVLRDRMPR